MSGTLILVSLAALALVVMFAMALREYLRKQDS
jgi:hypothetical protein